MGTDGELYHSEGIRVSSLMHWGHFRAASQRVEEQVAIKSE